MYTWLLYLIFEAQVKGKFYGAPFSIILEQSNTTTTIDRIQIGHSSNANDINSIK